MTPEREAYAHKRITRLTGKLMALQFHRDGVRDIKDAAVAIRKAIASTKQSIKRWERELNG